MNIEYELKFRASPEQLEALARAYPENGHEIRMETVYYDTPRRTLSARRLTLRRRMENGVPVCTLKCPAGEIARGEFECSCQTIQEAIPELCKLSAMPELLELTREGLEEVCGARFTRRASILAFPEFTAELALDSGILTGGSREQPLYECEVELKSGSSQAMEAFAGELAAQYRLEPEPRSKFSRALALERGEGHGTAG